MTDTFDEQLRRAFDSLADRLRTTIADHVSGTVEQLNELVEVERRSAVEAASRQAAAAAEADVTARLSESFAAREAQLREAAHAEGFNAGIERGLAETHALEQARDADAHTIAEQSRALADAHASAARAEAEHAAALAEARAAAARADDEHAAALASAHEIAARAAADHAGALAVAQATMEQAEARVAALTLRNTSERTSTERLLQAVRALDAATSLSQTLDALASAARLEADRVAILLVRGDTLRAWSHAGFEALATAGPTFEMPLAQAGLVADAVRKAAAHRIAAGAAGRPPFAGDPTTGAFVAVPLAMNSQVIAVLCGEQLSATDEGECLATTCEVLARHAARVLESLTALRLAQLGTHHHPPSSASASPPL